MKFIDVPKEIVKNKIPEKLYIKITADLEKQNVKAKKSKKYRSPSGMIRGPKEFYTFEIDFVTLFWQQKKTLQKQSHTLTFAEELPQLTH